VTAVMPAIHVLEVAEHTFVPAASLSDGGADAIKLEHVERGDAMGGVMAIGGLSALGSGGDWQLPLHQSERGEAASDRHVGDRAGIALSHEVNHRRARCRSPQVEAIRLTATYRTSDGQWIQLACLHGLHSRPEVCHIPGLPDLIGDERFSDPATFMANSAETRDIHFHRFNSATPAKRRHRPLTDLRGQWAMFQNSIEVTEEPLVIANAHVVFAESSTGERHPLVASPVQFDDEPCLIRRAPEINEHGATILTEDLRMDWDDVVHLKVKGLVA
jgi:crotonobetainyl-CoA:carnitine CoA-transferase CaiB-like acyl-CoA transferase